VNKQKFETIRRALLGYTKEEYVSAYPSLTEEQLKNLIEGEANEPSRESLQNFTTTNWRKATAKWRGV
jgi:hypothetical protein